MGPVRLEICGGIATGKTTLARLCSDHIGKTVFEDFSANPFYESFYQDPQKNAFETEITFLLQHYATIRDGQTNTDLLCADFAILQDAAYADNNLSGGRLHAFQAVYNQIDTEIGHPNILVHLHCAAKEQQTRISSRQRSAEKAIPLEYLERINSVIAQRVDTVRKDTSVIEIDSGREEFANNKRAKQRVFERIHRVVETL